MIADTSFLIDVLMRDSSALEIALQNEITTTSISVFEVYQGLARKEENILSQFLNEFFLFSLEKEDAALAGTIFRELKSKGLQIDSEDCMIAAIAMRKNIPVLTRNKKHFSRIKNLKIMVY